MPTRIAFSVFIFIILSERNMMARAQNTSTIPVNVGVILDFDTWNGKMGFSCINMALSDFYASNPHYRSRLILNSRDSKSDVVGAAVAGSLSLSLSLSHGFSFLFSFWSLHSIFNIFFLGKWLLHTEYTHFFEQNSWFKVTIFKLLPDDFCSIVLYV